MYITSSNILLKQIHDNNLITNFCSLDRCYHTKIKTFVNKNLLNKP